MALARSILGPRWKLGLTINSRYANIIITPPKISPNLTFRRLCSCIKTSVLETCYWMLLAIKYHESLAEDDLCSANQTFFTAGSKVGDLETALRQQGYQIGPRQPKKKTRDLVRRAFGRSPNDSPGPTPLAPPIWVEVS